jgi:GntR family transcriptional regulator/MocR family aminotransferase
VVHFTRRESLESDLRSAIRSGRLVAGDRLPSTRAMAADLGLARGTVAEAYAQLQAEGYLVARHGSGTRVADVPGVASALAVARPGPARAHRFDFNPGLPDLTAFPRAAWSRAARRGLGAARASAFGYGDARGRVGLREALAAYLGRVRGVVADPEQVVVCAGFRHGLALILRVLAGEGATAVAMEDPCLEIHRAVARAHGLSVVPIPVDERGARTELLSAAGARVAVLSPAHQYPLGTVLQPERRAAVVGWAGAAGAIVVEDDYDAELRYDRQPIGALQALAPQHVVYGGTASKTLVPGLRLGWLVLPPALLPAVDALREAEDVHISALDQIAFAELLRSGAYERHVRRMRAVYRRRRDRVVQLLAELAPGYETVGASAGLRVLLRLPPGETAAGLIERAAAASVGLHSVAPCHHDGRPDREGIVLGYGAIPEHAFDASLDALAGVL